MTTCFESGIKFLISVPINRIMQENKETFLLVSMKNIQKKKKFLLLYVFLLIFMAIGCKEGCKESDTVDIVLPPPPIEVNDAPFTFLKVGNEWVYDVYVLDDETPYGTTFMNIDSVDEKGYFRRQQQWNGGGQTTDISPEYEYTNDTNWGRYDGYSSLYGDLFEIYLYRNCYVGQKWDVVNGNTSITVEVLSIAETVVVPIGVFTDCIKVRFFRTFNNQNIEQEGINWYHKDIGVIKNETKTVDKSFGDDYPIVGTVVSKLRSKNF